jgi:hypothetical protein
MPWWDRNANRYRAGQRIASAAEHETAATSGVTKGATK